MFLTCCLIFGVIIVSLLLISYVLTANRNAQIAEMLTSFEYDDEGDEGPRSKLFRNLWMLNRFNPGGFYSSGFYPNGFPSRYNPGAPNEHFAPARKSRNGRAAGAKTQTEDIQFYLEERIDNVKREYKKTQNLIDNMESMSLNSPQAEKKLNALSEKLRSLKEEERKIKLILSKI